MRLILKALGDVLENVVLDREPDLTVGPDEVLVRIEAATINPVDPMLASGNYGYQIEVPFALGSEGVGRVVEAVNLLGRRVLILPNYEQGTWADRSWWRQRDPEDPLQLAMVGINPLTAHLALTKYDQPGTGRAEPRQLRRRAVRRLAKHAGPQRAERARRRRGRDGDDLAERIQAELGDNRLLVLDGTGDAMAALAQATEFGHRGELLRL